MTAEADIDYTKSAQENAEDYFEKAKELAKKAEGARKASEDLEKKLKELEGKQTERKVLKRVKQRAWYERFNWFFTSNGLLAIGGRSAQQNEEINAKYFENGDLFFHANVFGASAVVLKGGQRADQDVEEEAAQFAACYSKAWENGQSSVDVFAASREQVSKSSQSGYVATGSFLIKGERKWFRNVELELCAFASKTEIKLDSSSLWSNAVIGLGPNKIEVDTPTFGVVPAKTCQKLNVERYVALRPGVIKKSEASKMLSQKLGFEDIDYIMQHLPAGGFTLKNVL
ncbi:MAG: NFACT RNA binding domain-containing protein [Candidatus Micrarchaeia archaeon]